MLREKSANPQAYAHAHTGEERDRVFARKMITVAIKLADKGNGNMPDNKYQLRIL